MSTLSMTYNDENNCDCLGFKFNISQENAATRESYQHLENNEVDKILVQGMSSLSFNERQREQDDLHGVSAEFIERTDEMDHVLGLVQNKLNMIKHGTAYELAEAMNLSYVSDRNFRMPFLRANRYNPQEAADQMIRHFDLKQKLFGRDKLTKDIATSDLSDDDIKPLIGGSYHISKVRDRAGRLILLKFPKLRDYKSVENELRGRFYFYTELVKSLDSETRGVVMINYSVGQFRDTSVHGLVENVKLTFAMPFFLSGIHLCFDHQSDILLGKSGLSLVSPQVAARTKIHYGSHLECQYSLGTFGISATVLPLDITQTDSILAYQLSWYQDCLEKETAYDDQGKPTPNENDVLCLGRKVNSRGNERLLHMASLHQDWYNAGDAKERKILVDLMMESIRKKGGRFLKPDGGDRLNLKELPVDEIREKIAQMFRNVVSVMDRKIILHDKIAAIIFSKRKSLRHQQEKEKPCSCSKEVVAEATRGSRYCR
jgi:hypothetical protein